MLNIMYLLGIKFILNCILIHFSLQGCQWKITCGVFVKMLKSAPLEIIISLFLYLDYDGTIINQVL